MSSNYEYNKKYVPLARHFRKNMTPEEKKLWYQCLCLLPVTAHRQKNIGEYIVDFYIATNQIVIEVDGSQHEKPEGQAKDRERDNNLRALGITVLRYKNSDINDHFRAVVSDILQHLDLYNEETIGMMREKYRKRKGFKNT